MLDQCLKVCAGILCMFAAEARVQAVVAQDEPKNPTGDETAALLAEARRHLVGGRHAEARATIGPLLIDPDQPSIDVWLVAGRVGIATRDTNLAGYAFDALSRLPHAPEREKSVANLLDELRAAPIQDYVERIPLDRETFRSAMDDALGGDTSTYILVGGAYAHGAGVVYNPPEAVRWYKKAAEAGDMEGMMTLAQAYLRGFGVEADAAKAVPWLRKAAEAGDAECMYGLANCYANGTGVAQSDVEAAKWYLNAAEAGSTVGMYAIGQAYVFGKGVAQDDAEAVKWLRQGADLGDPGAMYLLGTLYISGHGVPQSDVEGVRWIKLAAERNDERAMFSLAIAYGTGRGIQEDFEKAEQWLRKAAAAGSIEAQKQMQQMGLEP